MNERREKGPLDYAREIAQMPTREARQTALEAVPAHWRELVRKTVESSFAVDRHRRQRAAAGS